MRGGGGGLVADGLEAGSGVGEGGGGLRLGGLLGDRDCVHFWRLVASHWRFVFLHRRFVFLYRRFIFLHRRLIFLHRRLILLNLRRLISLHLRCIILRDLRLILPLGDGRIIPDLRPLSLVPHRLLLLRLFNCLGLIRLGLILHRFNPHRRRLIPHRLFIRLQIHTPLTFLLFLLGDSTIP